MRFLTKHYVEFGIISLIIFLSVLTRNSSSTIIGSAIVNADNINNQDFISIKNDYESQIKDLNKELLKTKNLLFECQEGYKEVLENVTIANEKEVEDLNKRLDDCYFNVKSKEFQINNLTKVINNFNEEKNDLNEEYSLLAENFAIKYCCVQRIINPEIKYYFVENNTVFCSTTKNNTGYYEFYQNCP